jgi:cyclase
MPKIRVIPVVLLRHGSIVQSRNFSRYQVLGNPFKAVQRITEWDSDELIYLDISSRRDLMASMTDLLPEIAGRCRVPLTYGGGIDRLSVAEQCISLGADKFSINSFAIRRPEFITECASMFGSQCVVVSVDVKRVADSQWEVFTDGGSESTGRNVFDWISEVTDRGAGEILLNSIDQDGTMLGYDTELCERVIQTAKIPVIPLGGVGTWDDMVNLVQNHGATAVAAANIFHHHENSVYRARKHLTESGVLVRKPSLSKVTFDDAYGIL